MLEMFLAYYYTLLVFGDRPDADSSEGIVTEAFEALPTWQTKAKLLRDAARRRLGDDARGKLEPVLTAIGNAQQRRNKVAHARWATTKDDPTVLIRCKSLLGPRETWDDDEFADVLESIRGARNKLFAYFVEIRPQLQDLGAYAAIWDDVLAEKKQRALDP